MGKERQQVRGVETGGWTQHVKTCQGLSCAKHSAWDCYMRTLRQSGRGVIYHHDA